MASSLMARHHAGMLVRGDAPMLLVPSSGMADRVGLWAGGRDKRWWPGQTRLRSKIKR